MRTWTTSRTLPARLALAPTRLTSFGAAFACVIVTGFCNPALAVEVGAEASAALGADADDLVTNRVNTLDTIEAVGRRPATTGDVIPSEHTGSSQRIDRTVFERGDVDLGNVLGQQAGAQSHQIGGFGTFSSLTIRAATAAQTDVYLDGIRLNNGGNAVIDLATLELLNLSSIEVYRGTAPLQLGHGNIGGAVNLRTLDHASSAQSQILLGAGSFNSRRLQVTHGERLGQWNITAALSHQRSDNDFEFVDDNGTPLNSADDQRQPRNNAQARRNGLLTRASYQWINGNRSDVVLQHADRALGVPEWRNNPENQASFDTRVTQLQLSQSLDQLGDWNSRHALFVHRDDAHYDDRLSQVGLGAQDSRSDSKVWGLSTYWERIDPHGTFALSSEVRHENFDSNDLLDSGGNVEASRDEASGAIHYLWFDRQDRWTITPAIRWNVLRDRIDTFRRRDSNTRGDGTRTSVGPQLGFLYRAHSGWTLRGNVGEHNREPSFNELYGSLGLVNGNPDLSVESGVNADLGASIEDWYGWTLDVAGFLSARRELIVTVYDARGIGRAENTGRARVIGFELDARRAINQQLSLQTNLTVQDAINLNSNRDTNNKQLPGEASISAHIRLEFKHGQWMSWLEGDLKRDRFYDTANQLAANDASTINAGVRWSNRHWQVELALNNLTDQNIEDFNGFPRPGRAAFLSLRRQFHPEQ